MCLLTNERYKTYQTGFSLGCLGHAPGVGLGGTLRGLGGQKKIRNSTIFGSLSPGEGPKGQISFNLNYKVNFKDFSTKLCVSSHK